MLGVLAASVGLGRREPKWALPLFLSLALALSYLSLSFFSGPAWLVVDRPFAFLTVPAVVIPGPAKPYLVRAPFPGRCMVHMGYCTARYGTSVKKFPQSLPWPALLLVC